MLFIDKDGDLFIEDKDTCVRVYLHGDLEINVDDGTKDLLETYIINGDTVRVDNTMLRKLLAIVKILSSEDSVALSNAIDSLYYQMVIKDLP